MSQAALQLSYQPEDSWHGRLDASVTSGPFSGSGSAWFEREHLKRSFVATLSRFPLSADEPPFFEGGTWLGPGESDQRHLGVSIRPHGVLGVLLVRVDLATAWNTSPDQDQQQSLTVRFLTEYAALGEFASQLDRVLDGTRETAILNGMVK